MEHPEHQQSSEKNDSDKRERPSRRRLRYYLKEFPFANGPRIRRAHKDSEPEKEVHPTIIFKCPECGSREVWDATGGGMLCDDCGHQGADETFEFETQDDDSRRDWTAGGWDED